MTSDHQLNRAQEKVSFFAPFFMASYWKAMKKWAEENDAFSCVTFCMRLLRWWSLLNTTTDNVDRDNSSDLWGFCTLSLFNNQWWLWKLCLLTCIYLYVCVHKHVLKPETAAEKPKRLFISQWWALLAHVFHEKMQHIKVKVNILFTFSHLLSSLEVKF